jgi:hypothetical protein
MNTTTRSDIDKAPGHLRGLLRHFADLRDGTHGEGAVSRVDKEKIFIAVIDYLTPYARQALGEINSALMLASGTVAASGVTKSPEGGLKAVWTLSWPEQEQAGISPVTLEAFFGHRFHHPHLRGATVGFGPSIFSDDDAAAEPPAAIAAADLHNLVFQRTASCRLSREAEKNKKIKVQMPM